jgi:hypothetical protein
LLISPAMKSAIVVVALAAVIDAAPARACEPMAATAKLGRGICALQSAPEGVRARSCADGAWWTITLPPGFGTSVRGAAGGTLANAARGVIRQGQVVDVELNDGTSLWLGVSERRECARRPRGLVRYDWRRGTAHHFRGTDAGPCGFLVQDLLLRDDTLWVATDLGVSRLRLSPEDWDEWTHYAAPADSAALEETACAGALAAVAESAAGPGGEALSLLLAEFRPRFARRLKRGTRPASSRVGREN